MAGRPLPHPARVRGDLPAGRGRSASGASACSRSSSRRRRSTCATSGTDAGAPVREYLAERGLGEEVCREYRLGLSPGGTVLAAKARAKSYAQEELVAAGLVNRRGNDYFAGRLVFPLADARGRVRRLRRAPAARRRPDSCEVRQLARGRALPQGGDRLRARPGAGGDHQGGPSRSSSRATPTSSRSTRPASARRSPRWGRRSPRRS